MSDERKAPSNDATVNLRPWMGAKELVDRQLVQITTGDPAADMIIADLSARLNKHADRIDGLLAELSEGAKSGRVVGEQKAAPVHQHTDKCGFDRNASHSAGHYVCACGFEDTTCVDDIAQVAAPDVMRGLYRKYHVERLNDATGKHKDCEYYVLDLKHDKFSVPALTAYANACEGEFPKLAEDLRKKLGVKKETAPNVVVVAELAKQLVDHAKDWSVTAETADSEVMNETRMARDCAIAATALTTLQARLNADLQHQEDRADLAIERAERAEALAEQRKQYALGLEAKLSRYESAVMPELSKVETYVILGRTYVYEDDYQKSLDMLAKQAVEIEELKKQVCPSCKNTFLQPFVCITCGAEKLYDATLKTAQDQLTAAKRDVERLRKIAAHVPAMIYIKAKEDAGYGENVKAVNLAATEKKEA